MAFWPTRKPAAMLNNAILLRHPLWALTPPHQAVLHAASPLATLGQHQLPLITPMPLPPPAPHTAIFLVASGRLHLADGYC